MKLNSGLNLMTLPRQNIGENMGMLEKNFSKGLRMMEYSKQAQRAVEELQRLKLPSVWLKGGENNT